MTRRAALRAATAAGAACAMLLAACATVPPPSAPSAAVEAAPPLSGRLSIRVEPDAAAAADAANAGVAAPPVQSITADFELRGSSRNGLLKLHSPLGTQLAEARWDETTGAMLTTPQGTRTYADLQALALATLGAALPLAALPDWLQGRPWPGTPAQADATGFDQLGWRIDLARYAADKAIVATRQAPPGVTVRARMDR